MRIVSVSSSRADIGGLLPVWHALVGRGCEVHVVLTGMHRVAGAPGVRGIPKGAVVHEAGADLGGHADAEASDAMAAIVRDCGRLYGAIEPDGVLVLGDRIDMIPAVAATLPFNLPVIHLHGGEITEGAIDDRIRHAVTKLSHLHLVSCESAARRVEAMGEWPGSIVVTGAPGLDTLAAAPRMDRSSFYEATGLSKVAQAAEGFRLVTVHPETNAADPLAPMRATLSALERAPRPTLVTAPNSDPGGAEMKAMIAGWLASAPFAVYRDTLGPQLYPNAIRLADVMIGNSSSGIIEAGFFGLPVIDIGNRQGGREHGANVVHVPVDAERIVAAEDAARRMSREPVYVYGDGRAADRAASSILGFLGGSAQSGARV